MPATETIMAFQGVVAILVKDARVVASVTDFNPSSPGGFELMEAQEIRARDALASKVMKELASPLLSDCIDTATARRIMQEMCNEAGCAMHLIPIGHDEKTTKY